MRSSSSGQGAPVTTRLREAAYFIGRDVRARGPFARSDFSGLHSDFDEYRALTEEFGGFDLVGSRAYEIGVGQRPYRLLQLAASGVDVSGIDLDVVTIGFRPTDWTESWKTNGAERALKTSVRYVVADVFDQHRLRRHLTEESGTRFDWPRQRIHAGDVADPATWPDEPLDFIYSEDVFEHLPAKDLPEICRLISTHLSNRGVAMIRPNCFTGIKGGHCHEYESLDPTKRRSTPPWDHLRERRHTANTYLNEMTRADYRELFTERFVILDETVKYPDLGRDFMTEELKRELGQYDDDELISNQVRWVLKVKANAR